MRENRTYGLMREGCRRILWVGYFGTAKRKGRKQIGRFLRQLEDALYSTQFFSSTYVSNISPITNILKTKNVFGQALQFPSIWHSFL